MTTASIATLILVGVFLLLVFLRVPVVYSIGIASLIDFFYLGINPMQMALKFVSNLNSYTLLAVPFFILMGELMSAGGITDTLIAFSQELVGWMRGGAAMVNVVASFFFGAFFLGRGVASSASRAASRRVLDTVRKCWRIMKMLLAETKYSSMMPR